MIKSSSYSGKHDENPMLFDHFNLNFISAYVNGENKPFKPLVVNFETNKEEYIKAYNTIFTNITQDNKSSVPISRTEFGKGYTFIVFELDKYVDKNLMPPLKHGNFKLEGRFSSAPSSTVNVLVFGQIFSCTRN